MNMFHVMYLSESTSTVFIYIYIYVYIYICVCCSCSLQNIYCYSLHPKLERGKGKSIPTESESNAIRYWKNVETLVFEGHSLVTSINNQTAS